MGFRYKEKEIPTGGSFLGGSGGGGGGTGNYSTEETRIGTWIDGKPLYRKVIQTTSPSVLNQWVRIYDATELNVEAVCNFYGFMWDETNQASALINFYSGTSTWANSCFWHSENAIKIIITNPVHRNNPTTIVLEYTKTTDTPDYGAGMGGGAGGVTMDQVNQAIQEAINGAIDEVYYGTQETV